MQTRDLVIAIRSFQCGHAMRNVTPDYYLIANSSVCEDSTRNLFDIIYILSYTLCVLFFSVLLGIHYSIRYTFHPVFSFYFTLILIGYLLCDTFIVLYSVIAQFEKESELLKILEKAQTVIYSYLLPLVFFCTIERLGATIMVKKYENMRQWRLVVASQVFCVVIVSCFDIFIADGLGNRLRNYMIITFEVCIYIAVLALLLINQHLTRLRQSYDYTELTCRYQLAENIRACRFLLTFVLFDSLITATDVVADYIGDFQPERCVDPNYIPTFVLLRILSIVFELAIPWALTTIGHESYRNRLRRLLFPRRRRIVPSKERYHTKIRNVLGEQVQTTHTIDQYFSRLTNSWDHAIGEKKIKY